MHRPVSHVAISCSPLCPAQAVEGSWVADALAGGSRDQALTEAQLSDELGGYRELPPALRNARATISWWQVRIY